MEERRPRDDRQRIRQHRRHAGRRERAAPLEPELERDEPRPVAGEEHRDERVPPPAEDGGLRGDVAGRVHDPGGGAETGAARKELRPGSCDERRRDRRESDPERDGEGRSAVARIRRPAQREAEQDETGHRRDDAPELAAREPRVRRARDEQRQHADPARRRRLHERQRRELQRDDVEHPADDSRDEADQPPGDGEQPADRADRVAERERRQRRRRLVHQQVAPVDRGRRHEREHEPARQSRAHTVALRCFWNGR